MSKRLLQGILFLLALPLAQARRGSTGLSPLDSGLETISNIFNISVLQNEYTKIGIAKLGLFILVFAVLFWSAQRAKFPRKTAGIVAFVTAFIGIFFLPDKWFDVTSSMIAGIIGGALYLGLGIIAIILAFKTFNGNVTNEWLDRLIGIIIILFMIILLTNTREALMIFLIIPKIKWRHRLK